MSKLAGEMLEERMREEKSYHAAMQRYFSKRNVAIKDFGTTYPSREELHER